MDTLTGQKSGKKEIPTFSELQKEIIRLMQTGVTSKEILLLTHTTHEEMTRQRKMILGITHCSTMYDVIAQANKHKWLLS